MRSDQNIDCQQCQQTFVFTQEEQEFYKQKNLTEPKLCPICRAVYKRAGLDNFRGSLDNKH